MTLDNRIPPGKMSQTLQSSLPSLTLSHCSLEDSQGIGLGTRGVEQPPEARGGYCRFTGWTSLYFKILSFLTFALAGSGKLLNLYRVAVVLLLVTLNHTKSLISQSLQLLFPPNNLLLQFCPSPVWKRNHQELLLPTALWKTVDLGCAEVCSAAQ